MDIIGPRSEYNDDDDDDDDNNNNNNNNKHLKMQSEIYREYFENNHTPHLNAFVYVVYVLLKLIVLYKELSSLYK
jgi:hypothetical protein